MGEPEARADTVAIMQPYFVPYAGYFRLLAAADLFVIYDCVQFPRRGWVHRNRLPDAAGELQWLTLPLAKAPRDAAIRDLVFRSDAAQAMATEMRRFPLLAGDDLHGLLDAVRDVRGAPLDYIERLLALAARALGLPWRVLRSSSLEIAAELRGQDRILAIAQAVGARRYVNPPGGRELYQHDRFAGAGVELRFLTDYEGSYASILARLLQEPAQAVADEIRANTRLIA
ncbi:WbqC family protein [Phenylobacterium sp.]|mgnify:CR=1 FL=1|uniref:WbqC family protein n=1 Tax=Phenylobacterium sp. TaxID=1871053 RepID=UPI002FDF9DAC